MRDRVARESLRSIGRRARRSLTADARDAAESAICSRLFAFQPLKDARVVAGYWPVDGEVDPRCALRRCAARGQTVVLPKIADHALAWGRVDAFEDGSLDACRYGIPAPSRADVPVDAIDVVLVPGRAFDLKGGRLGAGMGYYDRTFEALDPLPLFVGLCFAGQVVDDVSARIGDLSMDVLVTDVVLRSMEPDHERPDG